MLEAFVVPGHFYSPIPNSQELSEYLKKMLEPESIPRVDGIHISLEKHLALWDASKPFLKKIPFSRSNNKKGQYFFAMAAMSKEMVPFSMQCCIIFIPKKSLKLDAAIRRFSQLKSS